MSGHRPAASPMEDEQSPIKLFGVAKTKICEVFADIEKYAEDSGSFLKDIDVKEVVNASHVELVESYISKTSGILYMIQRNCMKVAFFGRTSNGKSTVINAMLKSKILPSGIGHTTNCFVQVEGSDDPDAYILTDDQPRLKQNIQSVSHLAHALSKMKLESDSLIRVCWPNNKCRLLREDVIFVDSPGIDVTPDMDRWIDKFCLDADVFVLVVNAESTLMQTEKNFFHRVATRLSKPNIFILNNRWDASVSEPDMIDQVRQQHIERDVSFLSKELCVIDESEALNRIFFISALETLEHTSPNQSPVKHHLDGWKARLAEFADFERKFEECISHSALVTKFGNHVANAESITTNLRNMWQEIHSASVCHRKEIQQNLDDMCYMLEFMTIQQRTLINEMEEEIQLAVKDVYEKMFSALNDEIQRLSRVLEEYDRPFDTDLSALEVYKKELHFHVEECISRNIHVRCSGFVHNVLNATIKHMQESVCNLLTSVNETKCISNINSALNNINDFEMSYHLDCSGLLSDFNEDIGFHFSLGITSLVRRFLGPNSTRRLAGYTSIPRGMSPKHGTDGTQFLAADADSLATVLSSFTSIYSGTTIGSLTLVAIVTKSVGWKVILACAAAYCLMYLYERVTWTTKAKHEAFRQQYINYAAYRLSMVTGIATENCSSQVQRELLSKYNLLLHHVDLAKGEMQEELETLHKSSVHMDDIVSRADQLRHRADAFEMQLSAFSEQFLTPPR